MADIGLVKSGDYYVAVAEDAWSVAEVLGLVVTKRNGVSECAIPAHRFDEWSAELVRAGYKLQIVGAP